MEDDLERLEEMVPKDKDCTPRTQVNCLPKWELDYVFSMCPQSEQINIIAKEKFDIGGKSGAPFYFTHDAKYIIKMITTTEMQDFSKFFPQYFDYLAKTNRNGRRSNQHSLLLRVFGCHKGE